MPRLTKNARIEIALDAVKMHQEAFWEALRELETLTDVELESSRDFNDWSLDDFLTWVRKEKRA